MIQQIVYSHSEYFDVLDIFLKQAKTFTNETPIVLADKRYKNLETIVYDEKQPYSKRLSYCLKQLNHSVVLYQHEDMFLYKYPIEELLGHYEKILVNSNLSFIRLAMTGNIQAKKIEPTLFILNPAGKEFFACQPTLWKREDLIKFLDSFEQGATIYELEGLGGQNNQKVGLNGAIHHAGEKRRGLCHRDSSVWPYIATAICKGKWNLAEYGTELGYILRVNNINISTRGSV